MMEIVWVYKLCGTIILLIASLVFGWKKIREERLKIRGAEDLGDLVEYISEQIEYTMKPLPEILGSYQSSFLAESGLIAAAQEYGVKEAWERCGNRLTLPEGNVRKIFGEFCKEIGRGYRKEELELCGLTLKRLRSEIDRMKKDTVNREKLYRTLPPLMVLSMVLILL